MKTLSCGVELLLAICLALLPMAALAQSKQPSPSGTSSSGGEREISGLRENEIRGEASFFQHCGICHLPKQSRWKSPVMAPSMGPSLSGLLKGAAPDKEAAVRLQILKGTEHMPGFQYALGPKELDDVIAYMKKL